MPRQIVLLSAQQTTLAGQKESRKIFLYEVCWGDELIQHFVGQFFLAFQKKKPRKLTSVKIRMIIRGSPAETRLNLLQNAKTRKPVGWEN
jgi:hypothetical protein